jgi:tRNA(Arg) A34 adenosine deaminase TadA
MHEKEPTILLNEISEDDMRYMQMAIDKATENVKAGGGPFGAVIVRDGEVLAVDGNTVVPDNDPTAHAEVNAIRHACHKLNTFDLTGCTLYASCEPCPMCLSSAYWAGVSRLCFAATRNDAAGAGFSDAFIYDQLNLPIDQRSILCQHFMREEAQASFNAWNEKEDKTRY